jgi:hypothetical protein
MESHTSMKKISSASTVVSKRVLPVLWFGFLAYFVVRAMRTGTAQKDPMLIVVPVLMAIVGYFLMRRFLWNLVDEVYDNGDFLLIKNRGKEEKVAFADIMSVSVSAHPKPSRITLKLTTPGKFGKEITFAPAAGSVANRFAKDLIARVEQAKSKRGG